MLNKTCKDCNTEYDIALSECPSCHKKNDDQPKEFSTITMFPFWKQILLFVIGCILLNLVTGSISLLLIVLTTTRDFSTEGLEAIKNEAWYLIALNSITYLITLIALLLVVFKDWKKLLLSFKKGNSYIYGFAGFACLIGFVIIYNFVYYLITKSEMPTNNNETDINNITDNYFALSIIVFGFIGPICEELTYRVGLFSFLKRYSKWLAYPITILVFALIHFSFTRNIGVELLNLPIYLFAGLTLTYIYDHYGFAASLIAHISNNIFAQALFVIVTGGLIH